MSRSAWLNVARVLFLVAAAGFAWWGLQGQWDAVVSALGRLSAGQFLVASALIWLGVAATGFVWLRIMASYHHPLPVRAGSAVFFVGQLGKYIPGSVWSLGAQAQMSLRFGVPARTTVAAGLVFLLYNLATALLFGCPLAWAAHLTDVVPMGVLICGTVVGAVLLVPNVMGWIAERLAGSADAPISKWSDTGVLVVLMAGVWLAYGLATASLGVAVGESAPPGALPASIAAFALAYVVGVVVILAPSGLGAREVVLVLLLAPVFGVAVAAAIAIIARLAHTFADFAIAGVSWLLARGTGDRGGEFDPGQA